MRTSSLRKGVYSHSAISCVVQDPSPTHATRDGLPEQGHPEEDHAEDDAPGGKEPEKPAVGQGVASSRFREDPRFPRSGRWRSPGLVDPEIRLRESDLAANHESPSEVRDEKAIPGMPAMRRPGFEPGNPFGTRP